jgi:hypothetical protein
VSDSIYAKAKEALKRCEGDWTRADKLLRRWMSEDQEFYRAVMEPLIGQATWNLIRKVTRNDRAMAWRVPVKTDPGASDEGLSRLADANLRGLMGMPLPCAGRPLLGDATRSIVLEAAAFYATQAKGNAVRGRWLEFVAAAMPDAKKCVRSVFTESKLRALQTKAIREVAPESVEATA